MDDMDRATTHQPVLCAAVANTDGPVLELGCGYGSTPILHGMCCGKRKLITLESDASWLARFQVFSSPSHVLELVSNWRGVPHYNQRWSVAFVDHGSIPDRVVSIACLADTADYMVVHDTETDIYNYEPVFNDFKYRIDYKKLTPWTTVLSNKSYPAFIDLLI